VWKGYPVEGYCNKRWLMGLCSTKAIVDGIVLKAAWHWGSNSSVMNDPPGEPGCTVSYVGLLSVRGSMRAPYLETVNEWLWKWSIYFCNSSTRGT
jgi:hypothetical protein